MNTPQQEDMESSLREAEENMEHDMLRRVAGAILSEVPIGYGMTNTEAFQYARAALEAMEKPTEAMIEAGKGAATYGDGCSDTPQVWALMIDAALSPAQQQEENER